MLLLCEGDSLQLTVEGGGWETRQSTSESCQNVKFQNVAGRNFKRAPTVGMQYASSNIVIPPWYQYGVNIHASRTDSS